MLRLVRDEEVCELDDIEAQDAEPELPRAAAPGEAPDGAIEDDGGEGESAEASDTQVNLPLLEALLLSTHHPLTAGRLADLLDLDYTKPVRSAIKDLNQQYQSSARSFRIEQVAGGFQILTLPDFGRCPQKSCTRRKPTRS